MIPTKNKASAQPKTDEQRQREKLLAQLVYETDASGMPIYYKGYRRVLNGTLSPEAIIGSSSLQSFLVSLILDFLHLHPFARNFKFLASELGVQIDWRKWRSCDIAIYHRPRLKNYPITNQYIALPPDYVIEIDTKADLNKYKNQQDYFLEKNRQLHEFGVNKVIWIFTEGIPVIWESNAGQPISIHPGWDVDLTVTEGLTFNLARLIEAEEETN